MGDVWRAVDETLDRCVAVKMLQPRLVTDAGFGERFRREARAMAALRHPGVAQVYDYGEVSRSGAPVLAYIVMECVQGQPLSQRIAEVGRLEVAEAMSIGAQTARALQAAHDAGVIHRDVKPSNLIIEPDGHVVLVDFGVAVTQEAVSLTGTNHVVGTALYMAPEQIAKNEITPAIDIYALGAVVYHCLAGRPPHQGETALAVALRHLEEEPPPLPEDVPEAVRRLVATAMAKEPAHRFPTAAAMATAAQAVADPSDLLRTAAGATAVGAPAEHPAARGSALGGATRRTRRAGSPGSTGLAVLLGSLAAAAAVLVLADPTGMMPGPTGRPTTPPMVSPTVSPTVPPQGEPGPGVGGGEPATRDSAGLPVRAPGSPTPASTASTGAATGGPSASPGESTGGTPEPSASESAPTGPTAAPTGGTTEEPTEDPTDGPVADPTDEPSTEESASGPAAAPQA